MRKDSTQARHGTQAPAHDFHPRNPLGCSYALIPERLTGLPGGELIVLAWLLAARRTECFLTHTVQQLGAMTGWDSRTLGAHVASLREKGLVDPDVLRAMPEAATGRGERHARINVADLMRQPTAAPFRAHVAARLFTDSRGRLRVSRAYLAGRLNRTTRTVRRTFEALRAFGIATPASAYARAAKTVRSTRQKLSVLLQKGSPNQKRRSGKRSKKDAEERSGVSLTASVAASLPEIGNGGRDFEAKRAAARQALARLMREATA